MLKVFTIFHRKSPREVAAQDLFEAELALLKSEAGLEYARVIREYDQNTVLRLREYLVPPQLQRLRQEIPPSRNPSSPAAVRANPSDPPKC